MASHIHRLITSNLTTSVFVSSFRPRQLFNNITRIRRRSFSSECEYNKLESIPDSLSISYVRGEDFKLKLPGLKKTETDKDVCVFLKMPGVNKLEHVEVTFGHNYTNVLSFSTRNSIRNVAYLGIMKFPANVNTRCYFHDYKQEMIQDDIFKITLPKLNLNELNILSKAIVNYKLMSIAIFSTCFPPFLHYAIKALARSSYLFKKTFPKGFDSYSFYNKLTPESLNISFTPLTPYTSSKEEEEICVSLNMPELKIEDVKLHMKHGALYIEGQTKIKSDKVHYVTAIRMPNTIIENRNMIKTSVEMQEDGMYKATLSLSKTII